MIYCLLLKTQLFGDLEGTHFILYSLVIVVVVAWILDIEFRCVDISSIMKYINY